MIYRLPKFKYLAPRTIDEALSLLSQYQGRAKVLAGGTDLLIRLKERKATPAYLISLNNIEDLDYIQKNNDDGGLRIGALTIHQSIVESNLVQGGYELLATACRKIGTPQIRNMGTIGGNLCNASPSADSIPPLLVLGAKLKLASAKRWREVPLETFFIGPFQTVMENDEVLTEIIIPQLPLHAYGSYQWLTKITAIDETLVGIAALIVVNDKGKFITDVRIALSSVASMPMRANKAEDVLRGNEIKSELIEGAAIAVASEVNPRSRADYRRRMSSVLTKRVINEALARVTN